MGVIAVLLVVGVIGYIIFQIKLSDLRYRAKQHVLKDTGISSSNIHAGISNTFEKRHLERLSKDYPNLTEELVKDILKNYATNLLNKNSVNGFSDKVNEKMSNDSKLDKLSTMEFRRVNVSFYSKSVLNAVVVYTDNRDEYNINLFCKVNSGDVYLERYQISKGAVVGF